MAKQNPDADNPPQDPAAADVPADEDSPVAAAAITRLIAEIDRLRDELAQNNARIQDLERLAERDPLTPVANRRAFLHALERFNALARRHGTASSVIYLDVDGMKDINDRFGHSAGDEVLVAIAETLRANVRASDLVGRLGGDEFGVVLAHMDEAAAQRKARSLAGVISDVTVERNRRPIAVSVSWGVFTFTGETDVRRALEAADQAMYARKRDRA